MNSKLNELLSLGFNPVQDNAFLTERPGIFFPVTFLAFLEETTPASDTVEYYLENLELTEEEYEQHFRLIKYEPNTIITITSYHGLNRLISDLSKAINHDLERTKYSPSDDGTADISAALETLTQLHKYSKDYNAWLQQPKWSFAFNKLPKEVKDYIVQQQIDQIAEVLKEYGFDQNPIWYRGPGDREIEDAGLLQVLQELDAELYACLSVNQPLELFITRDNYHVGVDNFIEYPFGTEILETEGSLIKYIID